MVFRLAHPQTCAEPGVSRINRYLIVTILGFCAITALALVAIYTFISFVADIDQTGKGDFGVLQLIWYTLLMMPSGLYVLMPIIALLGTLLGLGALAGQNEINAMRAAGVTLLRLSAATLTAGALIGVLTVMVGDWLAPLSTTAARMFKNEARYSVAGGVTAKPVWLRDGDRVLQIRSLVDEHTMGDVDIYRLAPTSLAVQEVLHAHSARFDGAHWQLGSVARTRFGAHGIQADTVDTLQWDSTLSPEVLRLFVLEARSLSIPGLMRLIAYMDHNGLDASAYRLSLWRKAVAPLTAMVMMLFAIPFVLGTQRGGAGQRLLIGVLVGLVFYVTNEVSASLGELYGWSPAVAAALPTSLMAALAVWRLRRAR